jgi:hypothetical protein
MTGERMTIQEIESTYPQEYVLLDDPETDQHQEILSGRLIWHTKDDDEIWRKAHELQSRHIAVFYVGGPDEDVAYVL